MIDRIVVDQGGQVDQLDHGREGDYAPVAASGGLMAQEQQRRPEQLALLPEDVIARSGDDREVGGHDPAQLFSNAVQVRRDGPLHVPQSDPQGRFAHVSAPWPALSRARPRP